MQFIYGFELLLLLNIQNFRRTADKLYRDNELWKCNFGIDATRNLLTRTCAPPFYKVHSQKIKDFPLYFDYFEVKIINKYKNVVL